MRHSRLPAVSPTRKQLRYDEERQTEFTLLLSLVPGVREVPGGHFSGLRWMPTMFLCLFSCSYPM
jgi:hypothetical protein